MKAVICTEGGKGIGFGHITRCFSLYQELKESGINSFFIINQDTDVTNYFNDATIDYFTFDWTNNLERTVKLIKGADILIVDSYKVKAESYFEFSKKVDLLVSIDDFNRVSYPAGIVVNGSVCASELPYPRKDTINYLLGTKYIPLRKPFSKKIDRKANKEVKNVLIIFGSDDTKNLTPSIIDLLLQNFSFNLKVIMGKGFIDKKYYKNRYKYNERIKYFFNASAKEVRDLMISTDIAISAGGQTTYELASCATPTIGICVADNQEKNLLGWSNVGFLRHAGWYNDNHLYEKVKDCVNEFMGFEVRKLAGEIGRKHVDGFGSKRIVNKLWERFNGKDKDKK